MKNKRTKLIALLMAILPLQTVSVYAFPEVIPLEVAYEDPSEDQGVPQKGPVLIPEVAIEDHTLFFTTPCYGNTLRIVDEYNNIVYTTIIMFDAQVLPSTLIGNYELQIVQGCWRFYGDIVL